MEYPYDKEVHQRQLVEVICPVCGKIFIPAPEHAYKMPDDSGKLVCSWHCRCEAIRQYEAEENRAKRMVRAYADATLRGMRKYQLIDYIRELESIIDELADNDDDEEEEE